jgi:hypothetical protein
LNYHETNNNRLSNDQDKTLTRLQQLNESLNKNLLLKKQIKILVKNYKKTNDEVKNLVCYANMLKSLIENR